MATQGHPKSAEGKKPALCRGRKASAPHGAKPLSARELKILRVLIRQHEARGNFAATLRASERVIQKFERELLSGMRLTGIDRFPSRQIKPTAKARKAVLTKNPEPMAA